MSDPKRVLIVGLFTDPEKAPVTQAVELARLLKNKGYAVLTVSPFTKKVLRILDIARFITQHNRKFDVAIVQFYSGKSLIWQHIACTLVKWFKKKLIITIHGGAVPERMELYPQRYLSVLNKADIITCPSQYIISKISKYQFAPQLIENTIPLHLYTFFPKDEIRPTLLWMRAFSSIYNPEMAIRVVAILKQTYPNVKLFMGGPDMGMKEEMILLAYNLGLQNNIDFVGFLNFEHKKYYAEQADIYISTNKVDNAPVTFLEMWAMGLPVVSTNVGGVRYLIDDNENGVLVNDNDHEAMANKIIALLSSKTKTDKLIQSGKKKVKAYSEELVFKKWDNLLKTI